MPECTCLKLIGPAVVIPSKSSLGSGVLVSSFIDLFHEEGSSWGRREGVTMELVVVGILIL